MKRKKLFIIAILLLLSLPFTYIGCGGGGGGGGGGSSSGNGFSTNAIIYNPPSEDIKYSYYYYIPSSALTSRPRVVFLGHSRSRRDLPYRDLEIEVRGLVDRFKPYADQYNYKCLLT
jgi:hypothetical protein